MERLRIPSPSNLYPHTTRMWRESLAILFNSFEPGLELRPGLYHEYH